MGPKCSCLFSKEEPDTFYFKQYATNELNKSKNSKAASMNSKTNGQPKNNFSEFSFFFIVKLQSIIRGRLKRKYFVYEEKKDLEVETNKMINDLRKKYSSETSKLALEAYPQFNPNGWSKFYKDNNLINNNNIGCRVFNVRLSIQTDSFYIGQMNINNEKSGYGELTYKDGSKNNGSWINNSFKGWGRYIDVNGNFSEGLFTDLLLNGKGTKTLLDGSNTYTGDFLNGLKDGDGTEDCDEYIFNGSYKNDVKQGQGKITYKKNKDFYEGEFLNNAINGTGFYTWSNKHTYRGTFNYGKMHGKGSYQWPDGGEYYGDYVNNIKEGKGKFKWPNGREFNGPFSNGNPHGVGILTVGDKIQQAEFIDGKINKGFKRFKTNSIGLRENLQKGNVEKVTSSLNIPMVIYNTEKK